MPKPVDLAGERFGRLLVLSFAGRDHKGRRLWKCQCDCGKEKTQTYGSLTVNKVKSCGCLTREKNTTHGGSNTKTYNIWHSMVQRCKNPSDRSFKDYGGRGITVCDEWLDFACFREDMGPRPAGRSLDRVDVDGNYCKENCRWATSVQQSNNRRNNRIIEYRGERRTMSEWARHLGVTTRLIEYRLSAGWDTARALDTPSDRSANVSAARRVLFKKQQGQA